MLSRSRQKVTFRDESQGIRAPLGPTRTSSEKVERLGRWGGFGTWNPRELCEGHIVHTFPAAQKVNSVKGREGGLHNDQYSFPPDPYQGHARGQDLATRDPQARRLVPANTGVLRPAQPAAPDGKPRHQSTNQATLTPHTALQHRHASHRTRKTRHDTAHDRQANTNTSTAPPSRGSTRRLPWGARGCAEGDRRGLATDAGVHMIGTSAAKRTAEGHCVTPGEELCM